LPLNINLSFFFHHPLELLIADGEIEHHHHC
jgi:hypothetical protein